ncbi:MAG: Wzz/FepE/Etk N-terminal domain-containing protein [Mucinivorans sp.]
MENREKEIDLVELMKTIWRAKRKLYKWGAIGLAVGIVIAFSIPKEYKTEVQIAPEGTSTSGSMGAAGGLAAMMGVNMPGADKSGVTEKIYPEIVKSTPFLLEFASIMVTTKPKKDEKTPPVTLYKYLTEDQKSPWWSAILGAPMQALGWVMSIGSDEKEEEKIDLSVDSINFFNLDPSLREFTAALSSRIKVELDSKSGIYKVSSTMQDAVVSAVVADSLLSKLQRYMTAYRTQKTRADLEMNEKMLATARGKYYELDQAYAQAQDRNRGLIMQSAQVPIDRLSNEKSLAFTVYQQLASQVEMSRVKLQEDTPIATIIEPASVQQRATTPNKKLIVIAFTFLGLFAAAGVVVVGSITHSDRQKS